MVSVTAMHSRALLVPFILNATHHCQCYIQHFERGEQYCLCPIEACFLCVRAVAQTAIILYHGSISSANSLLTLASSLYASVPDTTASTSCSFSVALVVGMETDRNKDNFGCYIVGVAIFQDLARLLGC